MEDAACLTDLRGPLKAIKSRTEGEPAASRPQAAEAGAAQQETGAAERADVTGMLGQFIAQTRKRLNSLQAANSLSAAERRKHLKVIAFLESCQKACYAGETHAGADEFALIKEKYDERVTELKRETQKTQAELAALFSFVEKAFAEGNEMLVMVTQLTVNSASAQFIAAFGSEAYLKHSRELMLGVRSDELKAQIKELEL